MKPGTAPSPRARPCSSRQPRTCGEQRRRTPDVVQDVEGVTTRTAHPGPLYGGCFSEIEINSKQKKLSNQAWYLVLSI